MIFIFLQISAGLELVSPIPKSFYLAANEYQALELGEYFSGDQVWYEISPELPQIHLSQSKIYTRHSKVYRFSEAYPPRVTLMQNLNQFERDLTQFSVYTDANQIYLFNSNPRDPVRYRNLLAEIYCFSLIQASKFDGVMILAKPLLEKNLILYFTTLYFINDMIYLGKPWKLDVSNCSFQYFDTESVYLSKGVIQNMFVVTGYNKNQAYVGLYEFDTSKKINEILLIDLGKSDDQQIIFCVVILNEFFVYYPKDLKLSHYRLENDNNLNLTKSIYLTEYNITVTSLELSDDFEYLLVGLVDGFMIININFVEIYIKTLTSNKSQVYLTSSKNYLYLLLKNDDKYSLIITSSSLEYYIIGELPLKYVQKNIGWGIFNTSLTGFSLICNYELNTEIQFIQVSTPYLNITSGKPYQEFELTATENSTNQSITINFTIIAPSPLGFVEGIDFSTHSAVFDGLKANLQIRLYDYFCGYCLELFSMNLSNSSNSSNLFNMSYSYTQTVLSETIDVDNDTSIFNGMLSQGEDLIFYSTNTIFLFFDSILHKIAEYDFIINDIYQCNSGFILNITDKNINKFLFSGNLSTVDVSKGFMSHQYFELQCSSEYIVCQNKSGLYIYSYYDFSSEPSVLNKTSDNYQLTINYFSLYLNSYVCALVNNSVVVLFNIDVIAFVPLNEPLKIFHVGNNSIGIFCNQDYFYIVYEESYIALYNNYGQFLKNYIFQFEADVYFVTDYFFTVSNNILQVFNSTGAACGALIAEYSLPPYRLISFLNGTDLAIHFLQESRNILKILVPANHSTAFVTLTFINPELIYEFFYLIHVDMLVTNELSNCYEDIPINIFTNGETIYKNTEVINNLQESLKSIECSSTQLSLSNLFLGQDTTLTLESDSKIFSLGQKLSQKKFWFTTNANFTAFYPSSYSNLYLFANKNIIIVFNYITNSSAGTVILENDGEVNCISFSILYQMENLIFAAGCQVNISDSQIYRLYFFKNYGENIELISNLTIPYSPNLMHCSNTVGGLFALIISDAIEKFQSFSFACNHLQIIAGNVHNSTIEIYLQEYMNPLGLNLSYYYIIDFSSYYDPMFMNFYFYLLDWHYGIRIIRINQLLPSLQYEIRNKKVDQGVALTKCGDNLYVSTDNTTIIKFHFDNWFSIRQYSTIYPYKYDFHSIPSTLKCSSAFYPNFLISLIQNNSNYVYLHIINNKVTTLSSIVADIFISDTLMGTYAFMDTNNQISVLSPGESYIFTLNNYILNIDLPDKCESSIDKVIKIKAKNENEMASSCTFNVHIEKNYNSGKVSADGLPNWLLALIILATIVFVVAGIILAKRYFLKRSQKANKKRPQLFNYEYIEGIN